MIMTIAETSVEDVAARDAAERELRKGERLIWVGQATRLRLGAAGRTPAIMGVFFTAFSIFWIAMAFFTSHKATNAPKGFGTFFPLFGLPFLFVGLGMLTSPVWMRRKARKGVYAITDQRAIVIQGSLFGDKVTVYSYRPEQLGNIRRVQYADGSGDLILEEAFNGWYQNDKPMTKMIGFLGVERVQEVEMTLRDALRLDEVAANENAAEQKSL